MRVILHQRSYPSTLIFCILWSRCIGVNIHDPPPSVPLMRADSAQATSLPRRQPSPSSLASPLTVHSSPVLLAAMVGSSNQYASCRVRQPRQRGNSNSLMFMFCPATLLLALGGTTTTRAFVVSPLSTTSPGSAPRAATERQSRVSACCSRATGGNSRLSRLGLATGAAASTSTWRRTDSGSGSWRARRRRRPSTSLSMSSAGVESPWPRAAPSHAGKSTDEGGALPELNHDEVRRYSRHLILPQVGVNGQRRLKASSVLAVGTGGLGSPALLYLAAAGVGRLGIVDDDVVDESNLQRQVIHGTSTLGKPKVESARDRMLDVNPHVKVETFHEQLTSENALRICDGYDVVLDGSDNFPTKYLVNDACEILGIPNVYGAILGFEGQMSVFTYKDGPTYRDLLPTPPPPGLVPSCAEGGVLGILPGVVGCIQATEVIKILLGKGDVLSGRLLVYDALKMSFKESDLRKIPGRPPVTELVDYQGFCGFSAKPTAVAAASTSAASSDGNPAAAGDVSEDAELEEEEAEGFQRLSPQEVVERMGAGWAPFVLDVRLPQEAEIASLPFVDRVCPHRKVAAIADELPADGDLLVHCKVGGRSAKACAALSEHGIPASRLYNLEGGIIRWAKEVDNSLAVY